MKSMTAEGRPRAVVAAGPDSRLLRAVLEPWCPVPFVAWPGPSLPGWAGALDLVVVLAPDGSDTGAASAVAEAVRRGCRLVVACRPGLAGGPARRGPRLHAPARCRGRPAGDGGRPASIPARPARPRPAHRAPKRSRSRSTRSRSPARPTATSPSTRPRCSPSRSPTPPRWCGAVRCSPPGPPAGSRSRCAGPAAARRSPADAEHLLPVLRATRPRDLFADPFADDDSGDDLRSVLVVLDDGSDEPSVREQRGRLRGGRARARRPGRDGRRPRR